MDNYTLEDIESTELNIHFSRDEHGNPAAVIVGTHTITLKDGRKFVSTGPVPEFAHADVGLVTYAIVTLLGDEVEVAAV